MSTTYAEPAVSAGSVRVTPRLPRLAPRLPRDGAWGWAGPLLVTALAGFLRFYRLSSPKGYVFDEVYYAKDAMDLLRHGVEQNAERTGPGFVVHPPLGKWMIALGQLAFGNRELGWRFAAAVVGTLAVLILARTARRMTGSTVLGCLAGLLLALDGLEFVQSRVAMLDIFLMFWLVAALGCLVVDRDVGRARLAAATGTGGATGPRIGLRWWRLAAGLCLGAACACKWSGVYFLAAFGLLAFAWDVGARRSAGVHRPVLAAFGRDLLPALAALVVVPVLVYTVSWTGWFIADAKTAYDHDRYVRAGQGTVAHALAVLQGWLKYHAEAYNFHIGLHSSHPYKSQPWGWLLLARPVSYFYEDPTLGHYACRVAKCSREVLGIGTPAIWWTSIPATVGVAWVWLTRRDWRAATVLVGMGAALLPWFATPSRTMFLFYALPAVPFMVLGLTLCAGLLIGGPLARRDRRARGAAFVGTCCLLVVLNFFYLYPVLTAKTVPYGEWYERMWFRQCTAAGKNVEKVPCWI